MQMIVGHPAMIPSQEPPPFRRGITPEWAWGDSTGRGIRVGIVDSGIDAGHPAVGAVQGYVAVSVDDDDGARYDTAPHGDDHGHGTACAGIIRSLAPDCELHSVRVLGPKLSAKGNVFGAGVRWALENGIDVLNLSLGTTKSAFFADLHRLADEGYFGRVMLVAAANNMPRPSFPSTYASVIGVASHGESDPELIYYNPKPPVEFQAYGIDVPVAWAGGESIRATGNSFAAPHVTGLVARIMAKHPSLTPFELKTVLRACAGTPNPQSAPGG